MKDPKTKLPPVEQIGIVVRDIEKAIDYYTSVFGWGPFRVQEVTIDKFLYKGRTGSSRMKLAFARSGPIEIELIQVLEGETAHTDFLREKGEGLQHLRFRVDDLDGTLAELSKQGINAVQYLRLPDFGVAAAYVDSDQIGGVMFEFIEDKNSVTTARSQPS